MLHIVIIFIILAGDCNKYEVWYDVKKEEKISSKSYTERAIYRLR